MKKVFGIIGVVLSVALITGCGDPTATTSEYNEEESKVTESNIKKEKKSYKVGDDIKVSNENGNYRVKITKVEETPKRYKSSINPSNVKKVIIISYEYENLDLEDDLYVSSSDLKVYDKQNNILEQYYGLDEKSPNYISTGRKTNAQMVVASDSDDNYVEIELYDNMFDNKPICKIVAEW